MAIPAGGDEFNLKKWNAPSRILRGSVVILASIWQEAINCMSCRPGPHGRGRRD
jgi:hypothetical protein